MEDQKPLRHRAPEDVRRQKRKELDARRSKSRIRLGTHLEQWCNVKDQLGFHLHSDFAKFLLDSYTCKSPMTDSGSVLTGEDLNVLHTSSDALRQLVIWSHDHSRECGFIPDLKSVVLERSGGSLTAVWECIAGHSYPWLLQASPLAIPQHGVKTRTRERVLCSSAEHGDPPEGEHDLRAPAENPLESIVKMEREPRNLVSESSGGSERGSESESSERRTAPGHERQPHGSTGIGGEGEADCENSAALGQGGLATPQHPSPAQDHNSTSPTLASRTRNKNQQCSRSGSWESPLSEARGLGDAASNSKHSARRKRTATGTAITASSLDTTHVCESNWATDEEARPGSRKAEVIPVSEFQAAASPDRNDGELEVREESDEDKVVGIEESTDDDLSYTDDLKDQNYCPSSDSSDRTKRRLQARLRVRPPKEPPNNEKPVTSPPAPRKGRRARRVQSEESQITMKRIRRARRVQSEESQITMKKIRKKAPKEILRCEFEGCGKIVSNRQYLKHHMKYQHLLQRTFACCHPSCGRSFNFKKHLKEHEKLHSDKRDYICEFCARAFRTTSNLIIHRRIHTGEKPLQCEICGFTCRQKASLNWHMKKHDAESSYQFSCDICGKKFEKKDNVNAHKSKSHPVTPVIVP